MRQRMTDKTVRGLKPKAARYDVWDSQFTGGAFGVRVAPSGLRTFVAMARDREGRLRRLTLGKYPETTLSQARQDARAQIADLSRGIEPDRPDGPTFEDLAAEFLKLYPKMKRLSSKTLAEWRRIIDKDLLPAWETRSLAEIKRGQVSALLDRIAFERGAGVMANRTLGLISVMFNFAIDAGRFGVEANPCFRMRRRVEEKPRERVLTDDEICQIWNESKRRATGGVFRLMLLTGQRSGEVKAMRWTDVEEDVWEIPAEAAKSGRSHRVPLSPQALALLDSVKRDDSEYVFPSRRTGKPADIKKTVQRMNKSLEFNFRPHDIRRTVATRLAQLGFANETIGRVLGHAWVDKNVTARIYAVDDRLPEKREALEQWGVHLERILAEGTEAASDLRQSGRATP